MFLSVCQVKMLRSHLFEILPRFTGLRILLLGNSITNLLNCWNIVIPSRRRGICQTFSATSMFICIGSGSGGWSDVYHSKFLKGLEAMHYICHFSLTYGIFHHTLILTSRIFCKELFQQGFFSVSQLVTFVTHFGEKRGKIMLDGPGRIRMDQNLTKVRFF